MTVKTIPYSQFKQYLADGEVGECQVQDLEIIGRIVSKKSQPEAPAATTEKPGSDVGRGLTASATRQTLRIDDCHWTFSVSGQTLQL
jgi:hypothetical protein